MKKLLSLLFFPLLVLGQKNTSTQLDNYMQAQADYYNFSGTVLVKKHDQVIFKKAYGLADLESSIPNEIDTKFWIGSITKQFTAVAILKLEEQGKLNLTDNLSKYFITFPQADQVTIHMLLSHTSGIADWTELPEADSLYQISNNRDSIISLIKKQKYDFAPGTKFKYSNSNYYLLACIIEYASKQTYSSFLTKYVFKAIGMTNSGVDRLDTILSKRAKGYVLDDTKYIIEKINISNALGAGDIYSTIEDLGKWNTALYNTAFLSQKSVQKMYTPNKENYGYGVNILPFENSTIIQHSGGIAGFKSSIVWYPSDSSCVIVLSNNSSQSPSISFALASIIHNGLVQISSKHIERTIQNANLNKYTGTYLESFLGSPNEIKIIKKDNKLFIYVNGTEDIELKPESPTKFYYTNGADKQIQFELDKKGNIINSWRLVYGLRIQLKKAA